MPLMAIYCYNEYEKDHFFTDYVSGYDAQIQQPERAGKYSILIQIFHIDSMANNRMKEFKQLLSKEDLMLVI